MSIMRIPTSLRPFALLFRSPGREDAAVGVRVRASSPIPVQRAHGSAGVCGDRRGSALWRKRVTKKKKLLLCSTIPYR